MSESLLRRLTTLTASTVALAERPGVAESDSQPAPAAVAPDAGESAAETRQPVRIGWAGVIGIEGEITGDGRLIEQNALRWDDLPIPFRHVVSDVGAHDGAQVVGQILTIDRASSGRLLATGYFDGLSEQGREAARQVGSGMTRGVSMDLDDVSFEVRVAASLLEADMGEMPDAADADADGRVTVAEIRSDDEVMVTLSGRVRAATQVAIPAFSRAVIALTGVDEYADDEVDGEPGDIAPALAASASAAAAAAPRAPALAYPVEPPSAWFANPYFHEVAPLTVTREGRVLGHLAQWNTCHTGGQHADRCVVAPRSATGYAYFLVGSVLTAEGTEVRVGRITLDTGHAGEGMGATPALAHYDNTGAAVADVACGEDEHGIWVSGAMRPGVAPEKVRVLRASPLSGDWRRIGGSLELVAALAVNSPGFPIPRPRGLVASGAVQSLVAAGMVPPSRVLAPGTEGALSTDDLRYLKRLAARERASDLTASAARSDDGLALAQRVLLSTLAVKRRGWTDRVEG